MGSEESAGHEGQLPAAEEGNAGDDDDDAGEPWALEDVGLEGLASSFPLEQMELDADAVDGVPDGLEQEASEAGYAEVEQYESAQITASGEPGEPTDADEMEAVNVAELLATGMAEEGEEEDDEEEEDDDYDPFSTEPMAG